MPFPLFYVRYRTLKVPQISGKPREMAGDVRSIAEEPAFPGLLNFRVTFSLFLASNGQPVEFKEAPA